MRLSNHKIEKAVANPKHEVRGMLTQPYLDVEHERIIASDGHIAAIVPVELLDPDDVSGYLSTEAIVAARKANRKQPELTANGSIVVKDGPQYQRPDLGKFPDIDRFVKKPPSRKPDIVFDAELLYRLIQALSDTKSKRVRIWLPKDGQSDSIIVEPAAATSTVPGAYGALMPCKD